MALYVLKKLELLKILPQRKLGPDGFSGELY